MIVVDHVSKSFGDTKVIKDVSLEIQTGGVTCVIGPNGAGKSTLLTMMARLSAPDTGTITVDGLDVQTTKSDQLSKRLAILRQQNTVAVRLTVRELVEFGRFPYSQGRLTAEDKVHVDQSLDYLDLTDLQHRYLDQLSGGQRQRAFVAMVLAQDTDVILLDEPLNNLDIKYSVAMMELARKAADELGKTIVIVIHDINFAAAYSDRILAMKDGEVVIHDTPSQVMRPAVLSSLYDMEMDVAEISGRSIAMYFRRGTGKHQAWHRAMPVWEPDSEFDAGPVHLGTPSPRGRCIGG
ncbi:ATP-binding cassette domain-containing protein [Corynebacterium ulceribovis]|uniref:ATP-binding cassette domain-containing protein n=1 Tax=Corynebacterium ulceribovis TaxID=487732 RepID=UPI000382DCF0